VRKKKPQARPFKLLLVGDIMLGRLVNEILKVEPPAYPWGDTLPLFQQADVRACNLECVLSDAGTPWSATPKIFHFRSDAKNVAVLQAAHVDAVSMANNHVLDFDMEGLLEMKHHLKQAGIHSAGAGTTLKEAAEPVIWKAQGRKLGLIACTDNEPEWAASEKRPGVWYVPTRVQDRRAHQLFDIVQRTKASVACLIISVHWGSNWGYDPPAGHQPFAHALIDQGADIVFGHSGHVVRGIEVYKGKPIIYCAGNFLDDYAVDPVERNDQSFLFLMEFRETMPSHLFLYPTVIDHLQAKRANDEESKIIREGMQKRCTQLGTETQWNDQEKRLEVDIGLV
jgi:poly-gamma-glutamate capsule biosynthesis protein CapA/YwtB (metallophosphatase superfamily)